MKEKILNQKENKNNTKNWKVIFIFFKKSHIKLIETN